MQYELIKLSYSKKVDKYFHPVSPQQIILVKSPREILIIFKIIFKSEKKKSKQTL